MQGFLFMILIWISNLYPLKRAKALIFVLEPVFIRTCEYREEFIKKVYEFSKLENKGFNNAIYVDEHVEI